MHNVSLSADTSAAPEHVPSIGHSRGQWNGLVACTPLECERREMSGASIGNDKVVDHAVSEHPSSLFVCVCVRECVCALV